MPGPPIALYVAGPPCQPWARGGKALGGPGPPGIALFDQSTRLTMADRPLAFILEESAQGTDVPARAVAAT